MTQAPPTLAQSFAGIAAAMGAMAETRARRGEVAHALILALLAGTLACLAILAAEWEAGRRAPAPTPKGRHAPRRPSQARPHQAQATPGVRPRAPQAPAPSIRTHPAPAPRPWRPPRRPPPALHPPRFSQPAPASSFRTCILLR